MQLSVRRMPLDIGSIFILRERSDLEIFAIPGLSVPDSYYGELKVNTRSSLVEFPHARSK